MVRGLRAGQQPVPHQVSRRSGRDISRIVSLAQHLVGGFHLLVAADESRFHDMALIDRDEKFGPAIAVTQQG